MSALKPCLTAALIFSGTVSVHSATTYETAASGGWTDTSTWDINGVPVSAGDETVNIRYHSVTNEDDALTVYQLNVGSKSNTQIASLVKKGGVFTSQRQTEVGNATSRSWPSILELDGATGVFQNYRLTVGRKGGNAQVKVRNGRLETEGGELLVGIATTQDAQPNVIDLQDSVWTNRATFSLGYTSLGTNVIHLDRSALYSTQSLKIGTGTPADNTSVIGQCFLIAENGSKVEVPGKSVFMPYNAYQGAHVVISNSSLDVDLLTMGYRSGTTNSLALIDSVFSNRTGKASIGAEKDTLSRLLLKDLKKEKQSADAVFGQLEFKSKTDGRRAFDVEIVGGDWVSTSAFMVCQEHNDRRILFRDLDLPMSKIYAGYNCADGVADLVISNCTADATQLVVANGAGTRGTVKVYDSILTNISTCIVSDDDPTASGSLLLSGGTYAMTSELRVRNGNGRIVLDRGARVTVHALYVPNLTGSSAYLEIGDGSECCVTNKFYIGNQIQTSSEVLVKDGGRLLVTAPLVGFGANPASFSFTIAGEGSEARFPSATAFATAAGTTGTLNLDGGLFETKSFGAPDETANQIINFNGGVLKAREAATLTQTHSRNYVDVGGAIIETSGEDHTVGLYGVLRHKGEASVTDGGLTKQGPGTLSLYSTNTFNGPVVVKQGKLTSACMTAASLPDGVTVSLDLANGACLGRTNKGSYPSTLTINVTNAAALDPNTDYTIAENWNGACAATVNLPQGWVTRLKGTTLQAHNKKGVILIVR